MLDGKRNDARQDERKNNAGKRKPSASLFFCPHFRATQSGMEVLIVRDIGYDTRRVPRKACTHMLRTLHGPRFFLSGALIYLRR